LNLNRYWPLLFSEVGDGDEVEGDRKFINLDRDRVRVSSFTNLISQL